MIGDRMTDPAFLDELTINATAATTHQVVDGWLLRAAPALPFRRSNCAIPLRAAATIPISVIEEFYEDRELTPRVQVTTGADPAVDARLAQRNYEIEAPVDILVAPSATVESRARAAANVHLSTITNRDDRFAGIYSRLHDGNDRVRAYGEMMATIGPPARAVIAKIDGEPVGMAFGVAERGWCGVYGMSTVPGMRRRGIAQTVLRALARDAPNLYLQVERDNAAARALYDNVGFTHAYGYHYRVKR